MIDCYSKFIAIEMLKNVQSSTVLNKCKFSHDLGPQKS